MHVGMLETYLLKTGMGSSQFFYSKDGVCLGWFRTPLSAGVELHGGELIVEASDAKKYPINISKGIPDSIFFDGDVSDVEKCAN